MTSMIYEKLNVFIFLLILSCFKLILCENRTEIDREQLEIWKMLIHKFVENYTISSHNSYKGQQQCYKDLLLLTEWLRFDVNNEDNDDNDHKDDDSDDSPLNYDSYRSYNSRQFFESWKNTTSKDLWTLDIFWLVSNDMKCRLDRPNVTSKVWSPSRYCTYETDPESIEGFLLGYCIPQTCNNKDALYFGRMASEVLSNQENTGHVYRSNEELTCSQDRQKSFVWQFYATLTITFVALVLVLAATVMDCPRHDKYDGTKIPISAQKGTTRFARMFSLQSNFKKLIHRKAETTLDSLHFIRAAAMIFIILSHMYFLMQIFATNIDEYRQDRTSFMLQLFYNGAYLAGTFFSIGGAVQTYVTLTKFDKDGSRRVKTDNNEGENDVTKRRKPKFSLITWLCLVVNRYFRIIPLYLFCIMLITYVLPHYNQYPIWPPADPSVQCPGDLWRQLIFINNFKRVQLCMPWSWYLAVDFQLFLIFTPVVGLFVYRPRYAIIFSLACLIASCTIRAVLVMANYFAPAVMLILPLSQYNENFRTYSFEIYMKPYTWAPSYIIGMLTGYTIYRLRHCRFIKLKTSVQVVLWFCSILCFLWTPFGLYFNVNFGFKNAVYDSIYAALNTVAWSLALGWFAVYLECYNRSIVIKKLFKMRCWLVLSNLTFGCYLMHLPFAFFLTYSYALDKGGQPRIYISPKDLYGLFVCTMLVSYVTSLCLYLLIEGPAANFQVCLLRTFFTHLRNRRSRPHRNQSINSSSKDNENVGLVIDQAANDQQQIQQQQQERKDSGNEPLFKYSNNSTIRF